jgi:hypothetical protein
MSFSEVPIVQGFTWVNPIDPNDPRSETVCKIIARSGSDVMLRTEGPMFSVQFGDGTVLDVPADELHPWYPTE